MSTRNGNIFGTCKIPSEPLRNAGSKETRNELTIASTPAFRSCIPPFLGFLRGPESLWPPSLVLAPPGPEGNGLSLAMIPRSSDDHDIQPQSNIPTVRRWWTATKSSRISLTTHPVSPHLSDLSSMARFRSTGASPFDWHAAFVERGGQADSRVYGFRNAESYLLFMG